MYNTHQGAIRRMADGGLIGSIKRAVGMAPPETVEQKFARQDAELTAKQAKKSPPPAAPAPNTISGYAGMTAMQQREKAAGLAKGGAVKGKGGPTEDNIPIMASSGEFMIKAAAVKKIGVKALEALNAIADKPGDKKPVAKKGAIRKMATGGLVEDERRAQAVAQIPTGGDGVVTGGEPVTGSTLSRNASNTLNAFGGVATGASALPRATGAISTAATRIANAAGATGAAGLVPTVLSIPAQATPAAVNPAPVAPVAPTAQPTAIGSAFAATDPRRQDVQAPLSAYGQSDAGAGVTKFAIPGKSPLFTNVADQADNAALMARGPISAQNQGAAQALADRSDASISNQVTGQLQKEQYDKEVAQAAAINQGTRNKILQDRYLRGDRAAGALLKNQAQNTLETRGQDIQASNFGAIQKLAQQKFGVDAAGAAIDQQGKTLILQAQNAYQTAKTPEARAKAEETLRALQGKYEKAAPPEQFAYAPGGQAVDPATGQLVTQPGVIFNKATGQVASQAQTKPAPTFETGKVYKDAKGVKAKWDGQKFVPA